MRAPTAQPGLLFCVGGVLMLAGSVLSGIEPEWFVPITHITWDGQPGAVFHDPVHFPLGRQLEIDFRTGYARPALMRWPDGTTQKINKRAVEIRRTMYVHADEFDTIVMDGGKWIDQELAEIGPAIEEWAAKHNKHAVRIQHRGLCFGGPCEEAFLINHSSSR